jgi:hypothetical protein
MSAAPIRAVPGAAAAPSAEPAEAKPTDPALHRACEEFETAFIKQLLTAAKVGGKQQDHGYGAMAVDALADGIVAGGGLGLARAVERALERQHEADSVPQSPGAR